MDTTTHTEHSEMIYRTEQAMLPAALRVCTKCDGRKCLYCYFSGKYLDQRERARFKLTRGIVPSSVRSYDSSELEITMVKSRNHRANVFKGAFTMGTVVGMDLAVYGEASLSTSFKFRIDTLTKPRYCVATSVSLKYPLEEVPHIRWLQLP